MKKMSTLWALCVLLTTVADAQLAVSINSFPSDNMLRATVTQSLVFKDNHFTPGRFAGLTFCNSSHTLSPNSGIQNSVYSSGAYLRNAFSASNTATGFGALESIGTGLNNTADGEFALESTTSGNDNTAVGVYANNNGNGSSNSSFGYQSLDVNTGSYNNAFGAYALLNNSSGQENVAMGDSALEVNTTGSNNTAIGAYAGPGSGSTALTNSSAFGYQATVAASNKVVIGNSSVTSIGGYAGWTNYSDGRYKKNIQENVPGLAFIRLLRPVTYTLDIKGINSFIRGEKGLPSSVSDESSISEKEQIVYTGFVAQEVEVSARKVNYTFSGVVAPQNDKDLYGLRYSDFVVPMVKALQELSATNDSLHSVIDSLRSVQANLQTQVNNIIQQVNSLKATALSGQTPALQQNAPNPFNGTTTINYYLPNNSSNAQLIITDGQGHVLKDVALSNSKGMGQAVIAAGDLASGIYYYSLVVNGKNVDTKKMILTK
jgi:hypothetical protein